MRDMMAHLDPSTMAQELERPERPAFMKAGETSPTLRGPHFTQQRSTLLPFASLARVQQERSALHAKAPIFQNSYTQRTHSILNSRVASGPDPSRRRRLRTALDALTQAFMRSHKPSCDLSTPSLSQVPAWDQDTLSRPGACRACSSSRRRASSSRSSFSRSMC